MSACPSCLRAQQVALHRDFRDGCPGCGIRELALMGAEERERQMDLLCHLRGPNARDRVRRDLRMEIARINRLRGIPARKEKA